MVGTLIFGLQRALLLLAITVALAATGLAHRLSGPDDQALAFAAANGVLLADICGDVPEGDAKAGLPCLACQITGAADLPPLQSLLIKLKFAVAASVLAPRESRALARVFDLAHAPQGPPVT